MSLLSRNIVACALSLAAITAGAQTSRQEMLAGPAPTAGVYMPYPDARPELTPVPEGYTPFYISHYGRHGSRYLINETDYSAPLEAMQKASEAGLLTPRGQELLARLEVIADEARGRAGELTPLGVEQHKGIARRLYEQCPEAFSDSASVTAVSTVRMRCAHSMFAFVEALKELNPRLDIPRESSMRHMYYLSYNTPQASYFNRADGPWAQPAHDFKAAMTQPARLMADLFTDTDAAAAIVKPEDLMWQLYWVAVDAPNMITGTRLWDFFTPEELFNLWQSFNYEFYTRNSVNPINEGLFTDSAKGLLRDMLTHADEYITAGKTGATLRFGHDSTIIPFAGLMHFDNCDGNETDPAKLYETYADWRVSPMASNVQLRFYRNNDGDILVKFMMNERETSIPCKTDNYPYYRWEDARKTIEYLLETPSFELYNSQK